MAFGESERIVARGLAAAGPDLAAGAFVATKLLPILPLPSIVASRAAGSRDRLEVAAIDLYQLHWPNPIVPARPRPRVSGACSTPGSRATSG